jgi:membrane protein
MPSIDKFKPLLNAAQAVIAQIREGELDYRAMSLVYTSLLALIPLLAVSFSILKAFGADAYLEPFLLEVLKPLSAQGSPIAAHILDSVRQLDVGVLGSVGLLSLLYTSVSLLEKIEESFNHIWRCRDHGKRHLLRRLSDYLSFIFMGPLLVFLAFGGLNEIFLRVTKWSFFASTVPRGFFATVQSVLPYAFIVAAFALLYQIIPTASVKIRSALTGGLVAGILWKLAGWVFGSVMASSAQYHAIYSTFAILILFMLWLYLSWLIVLLGVQVSFFVQHPRYLYQRRLRVQLSARAFERYGLLIIVLASRRFHFGHPPWTQLELAERLALPDECIEELLSCLKQNGFILTLDTDNGAFMPARDCATITLREVLQALRSHNEEDFINEQDVLESKLDDLIDELESANKRVLQAKTVRDLLND